MVEEPLMTSIHTPVKTKVPWSANVDTCYSRALVKGGVLKLLFGVENSENGQQLNSSRDIKVASTIIQTAQAFKKVSYILQQLLGIWFNINEHSPKLLLNFVYKQLQKSYQYANLLVWPKFDILMNIIVLIMATN